MIILLFLLYSIYDHVLCKYGITLFACECGCVLKREDCCCIVILTILSTLGVLTLSIGWLRAASGRMGCHILFVPVHKWVIIILHVYIICYSIWAFVLFYHCLYLSEVTNKVQSFLFALNFQINHIDGLSQNYSNSSPLAMELLQSCAMPSTWRIRSH